MRALLLFVLTGLLAAWCQRCHILHDGPEHRRRRWTTLFRRRALGDLFQGVYRSQR